MIVGISIRNFRAIQKIDKLPLSPFHVLVGPNGSGKSTFLDAVDFVRDCLTDGPRAAVENRGVADFKDMTWMRQGGKVEIALWLALSPRQPIAPDEPAHDLAPQAKTSVCQYRLAIGQDPDLGVCVAKEALGRHDPVRLQEGVFNFHDEPSRLLGKTSSGKDSYVREKGDYTDSFNFGKDKLTLALTPPDDKLYPTANAVRRFLMEGIRYLQLDSPAMRRPCPATRSAELALDGSNLARTVGHLMGASGPGPHWALPESPAGHWVDHLRYALPELVNIGWDRRQADNAEFLLLRYANGLEAPSWVLSDGTLRMLALTLPTFLPARPAVYMVEEPENGVHPKALEIILRALSAIPGAQTLLATHSPYVVQQCGKAPLLCFTQDGQGVSIRSGKDHPALKEWDSSPDLGMVFAAGVLE